MSRLRITVPVTAAPAPATPAATERADHVRRLVYVTRPSAAPCPICGFELAPIPCEAVRVLDRLAHVQCIADGPVTMRGGS
jgi:hypothetical protein